MSRGRHRPLRGSVRVSGDKSISHRALMLAGAAEGTSRLRGLNPGEDVARTRSCLAAVGVRSEEREGELLVEGSSLNWQEPEEVLDAGNSGTTVRLLLGLLATLPGTLIFTGDSTLRRRPMGRVAVPLRTMGAHIEGRSAGNLLPLILRGGPLEGARHDLEVPSAQVKSALLLAGIQAEGPTTVSEPGPSRDHTERMLEAAGVPVERSDGGVLTVNQADSLDPFDLTVPGDVSSAAFLIGAAVSVTGSRLEVAEVGLNPTRIAFLEVLKRMGAAIGWETEEERGGEPVGRVWAEASKLKATVIEGAEIPRLIDELPLIAVLAAGAEGVTVIRDAAELRVKESDRIATMSSGLRSLGVEVEELPDGMEVSGTEMLREGTVDSLGDHRIALAFAVASLASGVNVKIRGWSAVETSFPDFLEVLARAQGRKIRG